MKESFNLFNYFFNAKVALFQHLFLIFIMQTKKHFVSFARKEMHFFFRIMLSKSTFIFKSIIKNTSYICIMVFVYG
jgi:hypothetical protein